MQTIQDFHAGTLPDIRAAILSNRQVELAKREADYFGRLAASRGLTEPNIIATGDSWFDYPLILGTSGGVIDHLEDICGYSILNLAHHGDTVETTMGLAKRQILARNLTKAKFDLILVSGGGDDIVGDQACLWIAQNDGSMLPENAVDMMRLSDILGVIEAGYNDLFDMRDELAPDAWIVGHEYDFPQPQDKGVCGMGPWMYPGLMYRGWTKPEDQRTIAHVIMLAFGRMLADLVEEQTSLGKKFLVVPTQGVLDIDVDWANEIHATDVGFGKIAGAFNDSLAEILPQWFKTQ